jgi:hypothetical protein
MTLKAGPADGRGASRLAGRASYRFYTTLTLVRSEPAASVTLAAGQSQGACEPGKVLGSIRSDPFLEGGCARQDRVGTHGRSRAALRPVGP